MENITDDVNILGKVKIFPILFNLFPISFHFAFLLPGTKRHVELELMKTHHQMELSSQVFVPPMLWCFTLLLLLPLHSAPVIPSFNKCLDLTKERRKKNYSTVNLIFFTFWRDSRKRLSNFGAPRLWSFPVCEVCSRENIRKTLLPVSSTWTRLVNANAFVVHRLCSFAGRR